MLHRVNKSVRTVAVVGMAAFAALLSSSPTSQAYVLWGFTLGYSQRDFRIFNNFQDSTANDNTTPHTNFPGALGAVQAIWKGAVEWESRSYADGSGDPTQPNLGDGGAQFDWTYQGEHTNAGLTGGNVVSSQGSSCGGGLLAWTETTGPWGWRIFFCEGFNWNDGPGTIGSSDFDIQSVVAHELGHGLGLLHTGDGSATMYSPIANGSVSHRSIEGDDQAGIQAAYGVVAGDKCQITSVSGSTAIGGTLAIHGINFAPTNNEVWFTKQTSNGDPIRVVNVASASSTLLHVTVPPGIQDGTVNVYRPPNHEGLSNSWPFDVGSLIEPVAFGSGCNGLEIAFQNPPAAIGNQLFGVTLSGVSANQSVVFVLGLSNTNWGAKLLPFDLSPFGAPGCSLLVSADFLFSVNANGTGNSLFPLPFPNTPSLVGLSVFAQWIVPSPLGSSGGLEIVIQP